MDQVMGLWVGVLMGGALHAWFLHEFFRRRAVARWPVTNGIVVESFIDEKGNMLMGFRYEPVVRYRYRVAGTEHESKRVSTGGAITNGSHSAVERFLLDYPMGKTVTVRYDPTDQTQAALVASTWSIELVWAAVVGAASFYIGIKSWFGTGSPNV